MTRVVFMGTAELACPSLEALCRDGAMKLVAVVTQPDRPKGRELKLTPSPVKVAALRYELPVLQPERARDERFMQELASLAPELIVVVAYGQILPRSILELPGSGCLNVHASILPRHRGAAPIQWAILEDDKETGVTIMRMDEGLDTGPMLATVKTEITADDNASTLHDRLARLGAELLVKTLPDYISGKLRGLPQPATGASYARKIKKEDGRIDWTRPAREVWNRTRAFVPWPGAFTFVRGKERSMLLKIWAASEEPSDSSEAGRILSADRNGIVIACGAGALRVATLQTEGGKRLSAGEFLAGHAIAPGMKVG